MKQLRKFVISLLAACMLGAAFVSAPSQALAGGSLTVNCTGTDYTTIGAALAAAPLSNATITICGGGVNYTEAVLISGRTNLKLVGKNNPILTPQTTNYSGAILRVLGSTKVTLTGLVIDGSGRFDQAAALITGIEWHNSSGTISSSTIRRIRRPVLAAAPNGIGILIDNTDPGVLPVVVKKNTIYDYDLAGLKATGGVKVNVSKNLVRGWSMLSTKPVGIWFFEAADGAVVSKNTVTMDWGPEHASFPSGILLDKTSHAKVTGNKVNTVYFGIYMHDNVAGLPDGSYNVISGNTLTDVYNGIEMYAENASADVNFNKLTNNKIYNHVSGGGLSNYAIFLQNNSGHMQNTVITGNKIFGDWLSPIFRLGDTGTIGIVPQKNKIGPIAPPGA